MLLEPLLSLAENANTGT